MSFNLNINRKNELHQYCLQNWTDAIYNGDFERAISFDVAHYIELVKKNEDVNYWNKWQSDTLNTRRLLVENFNKKLPLQIPVNDGINRFIIVHYQYSGLAHETQLARNMDWLRKNGVNFNVEIVYLFGPNNNKKIASALYGVPINSIHFLESNNFLEAGECLHKLTFNNKIQGIIYPSIFYMAFWMSLFVAHGNQKFIQMKYYPFHSGRIKHWFGGYRTFEERYSINGFEFEQLPVLDLQLTKKNSFQKFSSNKYLTIGSISRPEKISDNGYNDFIHDLLNRYPSVTYLYTGRPETISVIPEKVRNHPRSNALGWVDPVIAISQFSIYLEPFPWGGGDMTFLALEHGLPYLTLATKENIDFGVFGFIKHLARDNDPILQFSFCSSITELNDRLRKLILDPSLRFELGQAWRKSILNYRPPLVDNWKHLFTA